MILPPRVNRSGSRIHRGSGAEPSSTQVALGVAAFVLIAAACLYLVAAAGA